MGVDTTDRDIMNHLRQGNLLGLLMKHGIDAVPEMDGQNYSPNIIYISVEDPMNEGKTLIYTIETRDWSSE